MRHIITCITAALVTIGCSTDGLIKSNRTEKGPAAHAIAGLQFATGLSAYTLTKSIKECEGKNGAAEACSYWARYPFGVRSTKLVVYFSGGDQACNVLKRTNALYGSVAEGYVSKGYVFACANIFGNLGSPSAGKYAYNTEYERVSLLLEKITRDPVIRTVWNGDHLLVSGVSHGATAPVLAFARHHIDRNGKWLAKKKTGACMLDGQYDVYEHDRAWHEKTDQCNWFRERSICTRYGLGANCAYPAKAPGMDADSIVNTAEGTAINPAEAFAIKDWKLVECGSNLPTLCGPEPGKGDILTPADMLTAAPIKLLCDTINSTPGYKCDFGSYQNHSHTECGLGEASTTQPNAIADVACRDWFDELVTDTARQQ